MGKIVETTINRFDGGITNDPRDGRANVARMISNFDILTDENRMTPYPTSESGDTNASTQEIQNYAIALRSGSTYSLYGLGITPAGSNAEIYYKNLTINAANDLEDADWTETANNASSNDNTKFDLFVSYKNQTTGKDFIFGARANAFWAYDPTGVASFDETALSVTHTNVAQGLVHSKDDILYIPYDNKIAKKDGGTTGQDNWTAAALTLPTHLRIRSIAEYGNDLAIACEPVTGTTPGFGGSIVYLWDRNSSLTTLGESIKWGDERLFTIGEINGYLIGISLAAGSPWFNRRVVFRYLIGARAVKFAELISTANIDMVQGGENHNNRLHFMLRITLNEEFRAGVWSVGGEPGNFTIVQERTLDNDTLFDIDTLNLRPFHYVGDHLFQSYDVSGTFSMAKTADATTFTATSIYETKYYNAGDASLMKDLIGVTIEHEALPSSGSPSVVVKYKIDNETTYSSAILTSNTAGDISGSIPSAGASLPKDYKEISFRIESTGKAVITGLSFKEEITGKRNYN